MTGRLLRSLGVAAALTAAMPAVAATVQVYGQGTWGADAPVTGHSAPGQIFSFSFTLYTPLPADATPGGAYEVINPALSYFLLNGRPVPEPIEQLIFYDSVTGGLFDLLYSVDTVSLFGPDVGSTGVLSFGVFDVDYGIDGTSGFGTGQLAITEVPEPAAWALMIAGFGATGLALRRRGRRPIAA